jgi:hypothetical protein
LAQLLEQGATDDGLLCDFGMPVLFAGARYNCRILAMNRKILLIRPKISMADNGNYRESRYFTAYRVSSSDDSELEEESDSSSSSESSSGIKEKRMKAGYQEGDDILDNASISSCHFDLGPLDGEQAKTDQLTNILVRNYCT